MPSFLPEILPAVEVGWRLGAAYRGTGFATEAAAEALRWGFEDLGLEEIVSIYEPGNLPSGRVMDRLGFGPGPATVEPGAISRSWSAGWRSTTGGPAAPAACG